MKAAMHRRAPGTSIGNVLSHTYLGFFAWLFRKNFPLLETFRQLVNTLAGVWVTIVFGGVVQGLFLSWLLGHYGGQFGATLWAGAGSTFLILRELSVVMTGILFACKGGTGFTVEIGSMNMSGQIDALRLMDIEPAQYLVVPRVLSSVIALPLLLGISHGVAILSTMTLLKLLFDVSFPIFLEQAFMFLQSYIVTNSFARSAVIGFFVAANASALGFLHAEGAEGLGRITTRSIVLNLFTVLIIDLLFAIALTYREAGLI